METDGQRPEHRAPGTAWVLTAKVPCLRRVSASTQPVLRVPRGCSSRRESVGTAARTAPQLLRGPERPWTGTFGGGATTSPAGMEEPTDSSSVLGKSELHTVFRLRTAGDLNPAVFQGQRSKEVAARRCPQFGTVRGRTRGKSWRWRPAVPCAQGRGLSLCSSRARRCLSGTHPGAGGCPSHLLPLHHVQQVSEGRLLGAVEGQQRQRALHLRQALPALLTLLRQLRLRELQRRLRLPLADQLDQVLLLGGRRQTGRTHPGPGAAGAVPRRRARRTPERPLPSPLGD